MEHASAGADRPGDALAEPVEAVADTTGAGDLYAAGVLFGVSDTAIKALTGITHAHGVTGLLLSPWLLVAVLASIAATLTRHRRPL